MIAIKRLARSHFVVLDWFLAKIDDHRMETALEPSEEGIQIAVARPDLGTSIPPI
jgi:hypothetical protein